MNYYYRLTKTNDNKLSKRGIKIPAVIKENTNDLKNCSEEEKELNNKEAIEYLLKNAVKTINKIDEKKLDTMRVLDKIRAGIPMRLKSWIKTMFLEINMRSRTEIQGFLGELRKSKNIKDLV